MRTVLIGQILVILGCIVYLVWWYRGFRPGTSVNRVGGINGALLLVTAVLALSGIALSLKAVMEIPSQNHSTALIVAAGIISYVVLMLITRYLFQRVVTTELLLIVVWTTVELIVVSRLNQKQQLPGRFGRTQVSGSAISRSLPGWKRFSPVPEYL